MGQHQHYTVVSAAGNRIVLIDQKITLSKVLKAKALLFCQNLNSWWSEAEVDELISGIAVMITFLGLYCALAIV